MTGFYCKICGKKVSSYTKYCKDDYTYNVVEKYECPATNCSDTFMERTDVDEHIVLNPICGLCRLHVTDLDAHNEEFHKKCHFCEKEGKIEFFKDEMELTLHIQDSCQKDQIDKLYEKIVILRAKLNFKNEKRISKEIKALEAELDEKYDLIVDESYESEEIDASDIMK